MELVLWNCGILGRAPVELLWFKELFEDDTPEVDGSFPLILLRLGVSCLRKCLNENGFSFGAAS